MSRSRPAERIMDITFMTSLREREYPPFWCVASKAFRRKANPELQNSELAASGFLDSCHGDCAKSPCP